MLLGSKPLVEATRLSYPPSEVRCWSPWEAHRYFRTKRIPMKVHLDGVSETELWAKTQQRWCLQLHLERLCLTPTLKHLFLFQSDHLLFSTQIISIDLGQTETRGGSGWTEVSLPTQQGFFCKHEPTVSLPAGFGWSALTAWPSQVGWGWQGMWLWKEVWLVYY